MEKTYRHDPVGKCLACVVVKPFLGYLLLAAASDVYVFLAEQDVSVVDGHYDTEDNVIKGQKVWVQDIGKINKGDPDTNNNVNPVESCHHFFGQLLLE